LDVGAKSKDPENTFVSDAASRLSHEILVIDVISFFDKLRVGISEKIHDHSRKFAAQRLENSQWL
jgi:hypothetical protein